MESILGQVKDKAMAEFAKSERERMRLEDEVDTVKIEARAASLHAEELQREKDALVARFVGQREAVEDAKRDVVAENETLKKQVGQLQMQVDVLAAERRGVEEEREAVLMQEDGLAKKCAQMEERLSEARTNDSSAQEQAALAQKSDKGTAAQLMSALQTIQLLEGDTESLKEQVATLTDECQVARAESTSLKTQVTSLKAIADSYDAMVVSSEKDRADAAAAKAELDSTTGANSVLNSVIDNVNVERVVFRLMMRKMGDKRAKAVALTNKQRDRIGELTQQLLDARAQADAARPDMDRMRQSMGTQRKYLRQIEDEHTSLTADVAQLNSQLGGLKSDNDATNERLDVAMKDKAMAEAQIVVLKAKVAASHALEAVLKDMDSFKALQTQTAALSEGISILAQKGR